MRISDWSSDVCSSDLLAGLAAAPGRALGRAAARRFQSVASRNEDRAGSALADGLAAVQLDAELVGDHLLAARLLAGLAAQVIAVRDRKSTRLNSSHYCASRMPSSA